jgi:hypothetical protein
MPMQSTMPAGSRLTRNADTVLVLPWVHRVFSNLKVWALGVYLGLRRKHVQSYLDEFVFRFNRRRTRHAAFRSLLGIAARQAPFSYNMLVSPEAKA